MIELYGSDRLFQWDINKKVIVSDDSITQVHFSNKLTGLATVCEVYEEDGTYYANIPNIMLQESIPIRIYYISEGCVVQAITLPVTPRLQPSNYIYTPTEVLAWEQLEARILVVEGEAEALDNRITALEDNLSGVSDVNVNDVSVVTDGVAEITLNKEAIDLGNVDNTSDVNKPISNATQTALNGKQPTLISGTNIKTINNESVLGSGNIEIKSQAKRPIRIGDNLKGRTIYFNTDTDVHNNYDQIFMHLSNHNYISRHGCNELEFGYYTGDDETIAVFTYDEDWLMDSYTFPNTEDIFVNQVSYYKEVFSDLIYILDDTQYVYDKATTTTRTIVYGDNLRGRTVVFNTDYIFHYGYALPEVVAKDNISILFYFEGDYFYSHLQNHYLCCYTELNDYNEVVWITNSFTFPNDKDYIVDSNNIYKYADVVKLVVDKEEMTPIRIEITCEEDLTSNITKAKLWQLYDHPERGGVLVAATDTYFEGKELWGAYILTDVSCEEHVLDFAQIAINNDNECFIRGVNFELSSEINIKIIGFMSVPYLSKINEHVIPKNNNYYNLGSSTKQWKNIYSTNIYQNGAKVVTETTTGALTNLNTTNKTNLVNAVNEVNTKTNSTITLSADLEDDSTVNYIVLGHEVE